MNGTRLLLYPLLAVAMLVSACAGQSVEPPTEAPPQVHLEPPQLLTVSEPDLVIDVGDRIFFDFDSATLRPDAIATIDRQAEWLKTEPDIKVMIEGHTDYSGPEDNSIELGCRRATTMRDALSERGIAAERLGTVSYGDSRPAVLGKNEAAWRQNRRAVLVVLSGDHVLGVGGSYCGEP